MSLRRHSHRTQLAWNLLHRWVQVPQVLQVQAAASDQSRTQVGQRSITVIFLILLDLYYHNLLLISGSPLMAGNGNEQIFLVRPRYNRRAVRRRRSCGWGCLVKSVHSLSLPVRKSCGIVDSVWPSFLPHSRQHLWVSPPYWPPHSLFLLFPTFPFRLDNDGIELLTSFLKVSHTTRQKWMERWRQS